jgi:hypothetical protein
MNLDAGDHEIVSNYRAIIELLNRLLDPPSSAVH